MRDFVESQYLSAPVAELVDAQDLKSWVVYNDVPVRFWPGAPFVKLLVPEISELKPRDSPDPKGPTLPIEEPNSKGVLLWLVAMLSSSHWQGSKDSNQRSYRTVGFHTLNFVRKIPKVLRCGTQGID